MDSWYCWAIYCLLVWSLALGWQAAEKPEYLVSVLRRFRGPVSAAHIGGLRARAPHASHARRCIASSCTLCRCTLPRSHGPKHAPTNPEHEQTDGKTKVQNTLQLQTQIALSELDRCKGNFSHRCAATRSNRSRKRLRKVCAAILSKTGRPFQESWERFVGGGLS